MFMASFNATVDSYRTLLVTAETGNLRLPNENFDLGTATPAGRYQGADLAYDKLLDKLAEHKFAGVAADLRTNILDYDKDRTPPSLAAGKRAAQWAKLLEERTQLEQFQPEPAAGIDSVAVNVSATP
jgi:hypothetical protein